MFPILSLKNSLYIVDTHSLTVFPDFLRNSTVVHLSKPPDCTTTSRTKRKRSNESEFINMEQNMPELKYQAPPKKQKFTGSDH